MKRARGFFVLLLVASFGGTGAQAHEGHDKAPDASGAVASNRHVVTAVSDRYEVVLKNDPLHPGLKTVLDLYLSDFQTNAPVTNATISLSLRSEGRELWTGAAAPTKRPGIFTVPFQAPPDTGLFTILATISGSGGPERFALSGLEVRRADGGASGPSARHFPWQWLGGIGALVLIILAIVARRRTSAASAALALSLILAPATRAHEGHDKAPTVSGAPAGPGAQIYIAKESQFLLGVLTEPLKRLPVQKRLSVLGRVAPRGGGDIEIVAPQSGRISFRDGRAPILGRSVTKGEPIATLTVVDDLSLRAPISGVLTGVLVVNGQLVEAGQKLMTLLDPTVVWVHADVYESDLASVLQSTRAVITSQSTPELALNGRRVALGVTQGEVPGAVEAWFEVPNVGGWLRVGALVDVGIDLGGVDSSFVVPRSAVFEKEGRKLVFVHTAPERFTAREVTLGTSLGARVVIAGALNPGDRVVVTGGYSLLTAPIVSIGP